MDAQVFGIFEIRKNKISNNLLADLQAAKCRQWNFLELEDKIYKVHDEHILIRADFTEHNLFPFHTTTDFYRFLKNRIKNKPGTVRAIYLQP